MRVKFLFIYILAGAAFIGVSLWVLLSGGKSARAVRYKYRLGGIMLTAWAMLSAASCEGGPFQVTCYEPAVPPEVMCYDVAMETDIVKVVVKDYGGNRLKSGDVLVLTIEQPMAREYRYFIHEGGTDGKVFQEGTVLVPEEQSTVLAEITLEPTEYKGDAVIEVIAVYRNDQGEQSSPVGQASIVIV